VAGASYQKSEPLLETDGSDAFPRSAAVRRILLPVLILGSEVLVASLLLDNQGLKNSGTGLPGLVGRWGPWAVKSAIGFAALFATFAYLRHKEMALRTVRRAALAPIPYVAFAAHFAAAAVFAALSGSLYRIDNGTSDAVAAAWIASGALAVASLAVAVAPLATWQELFHRTRYLWLYAGAGAIIATSAGPLTQRLWQPASQITFRLVTMILSPILGNIIVDPAKLVIGTARFRVGISQECSGLEGVALLLVFGAVWLVLFRDDLRFPQAFVLLPIAVLALFVLNSVRIALLVLIGNAGAPHIAAGGFHSQAGWIAFNFVALGLAIVARRVAWVSTRAHENHAPADSKNAVAVYVVPFLAIVAAGMISGAASGKFEWLYALRLFAATGVLWVFRRSYSDVIWTPGWAGPLTGIGVFAMWIVLDRSIPAANGDPRMPGALAAASPLVRDAWIALRFVGGAVAVPIAEELAFRGYLLRRFISEDFETVGPRDVTWFALIASSILFGVLHGDRWLAGTAAGILYGVAFTRSGRFGNAVAAHITTNALLAVYVLVLQQWHLW
jgi:exosortase E/protease (VPEID-CTERM system)